MAGRHTARRPWVRKAILGHLVELGRGLAAAVVTGIVLVAIAFIAVRLRESGERGAGVLIAVIGCSILVHLLIKWGIQSARSPRRRAVR